MFQTGEAMKEAREKAKSTEKAAKAAKSLPKDQWDPDWHELIEDTPSVMSID
jgi:hypothetical protein